MPFIVNPNFYRVAINGQLDVPAPGHLNNDLSTVGTVTAATTVLDGPDHGTYSNNLVDGTFRYNPTAGFTGIDTITVSVSNGIVSKSSVITIEVYDPNDPSVFIIAPNFYNVAVNGVLDVAAPGYLGDDFTTSGTLTAPTLLDGPDHGSYTNAFVNGTFRYTPNAGFTGVDTISVAVSNGSALKIETFTFNVYAPNDAPSLEANTGLTVQGGSSNVLGDANLDFNDDEQATTAITYTLTSVTVNGTLFNNGSALGVGGTFTQADIDAGLVSYTHNGSATTTDSFDFNVSDGAGGLVTGQSFAVAITSQNGTPVITSDGGGATATVNVAENLTAVTTVAATDDAPSLAYSIVGGSDAAKFDINATTGALKFINAPDFEKPGDTDHNNSYVVTVRASDGTLFDEQTLTVNVTDVHHFIDLTPDNDDFAAATGALDTTYNGLGGIDTATFEFKLTEATVSYVGNRIIIDGPSGSHTELTGFEVFKFTDGTVHNDDGDRLVDDLFYYSKYHDVWNAHVDADVHYHSTGWKEARDPDAFFSTRSISRPIRT